MPAARTARRSPQWRAEQEQAIRAYEAETVSVTAQLADPELDVPLDPAADLAGAQEAVRLAAERHDAAVTALGLARDRAATLAGLAPQFAVERAALEPLRERAEEARRLADLAGGQGANTLRMTLSAFVLAARLEEVAEAASQRLLTMTAGRYSLAHTDARRGGGGRSGLGLLACDSWTGLERDTSTLSGGETFLASLALALGLADVVTGEAAGVPIEALFVDEGFGSLDEDTLEEVMNVLDGLREGGRMVGIVSHVSELRQRIPAQVHVRKGRSGSTVESAWHPGLAAAGRLVARPPGGTLAAPESGPGSVVEARKVGRGHVFVAVPLRGRPAVSFRCCRGHIHVQPGRLSGLLDEAGILPAQREAEARRVVVVDDRPRLQVQVRGVRQAALDGFQEGFRIHPQGAGQRDRFAGRDRKRRDPAVGDQLEPGRRA